MNDELSGRIMAHAFNDELEKIAVAKWNKGQGSKHWGDTVTKYMKGEGSVRRGWTRQQAIDDAMAIGKHEKSQRLKAIKKVRSKSPKRFNWQKVDSRGIPG